MKIRYTLTLDVESDVQNINELPGYENMSPEEALENERESFLNDPIMYMELISVDLKNVHVEIVE